MAPASWCVMPVRPRVEKEVVQSAVEVLGVGLLHKRCIISQNLIQKAFHLLQFCCFSFVTTMIHLLFSSQVGFANNRPLRYTAPRKKHAPNPLV